MALSTYEPPTPEISLTLALVLREPQGQGLKQEEIVILTIAAGLFPKSFRAPRIAIGAVYDACFTREKEIR